jgi:PKD repeat protein
MRKSTAIGLLSVAVLVAAAACTTQSSGGGGGPTNHPPTAVMTASPTTGAAPLAVHFEGGSSVDSDGVIISWFWDFGDGQSQAGQSADHTYAPGTYTAQLLVTDDKGAFGTDSVVINATNVAPVAAFTVTSTTGAAPLAVTFDSSSSVDPDGSITARSWDFDTAGQFPGDLATGTVVNHTYGPGIYTAKLTVTDNNGVSTSTTKTISVTGSPAAPTGLHLTGSGCCDTYGDFAWNEVPGADAYNVQMVTHFGGGCLVDENAVINGQTDHGRVQAALLCLGTQYDISIQAHANGVWGPWSPSTRITL